MAVDPNSPKVLATLLTEVEASLVVNHLAAQGIKALASGAGGPSGWPEARKWIQVVVRQADFAQAQTALELIREKQNPITN
jgi:hypothetical protein